jgi:hypothetical protein
MASSVEVAACLDFSCVWLAFVLMLTIVHQPKAAIFVWQAFLQRQNKDTCEMASIFFKNARHTKSFA